MSSSLTGKVLIIEGLISAGKSTAADQIRDYAHSKGVKCHYFPEPFNIETLQLFISNPKKHALSFQLDILSKKNEIYHQACGLAGKGYLTIIDRSLHGDYCFAKLHHDIGNITDDEWKFYLQFYNKINFPYPDYLLYLDVNVETAMKRCSERNRKGESAYTKEYFDKLRDIYPSVMKQVPKERIALLDWNKSRSLNEIQKTIIKTIES